jgi:hypothetical protein
MIMDSHLKVTLDGVCKAVKGSSNFQKLQVEHVSSYFQINLSLC